MCLVPENVGDLTTEFLQWYSYPFKPIEMKIDLFWLRNLTPKFLFNLNTWDGWTCVYEDPDIPFVATVVPGVYQNQTLIHGYH